MGKRRGRGSYDQPGGIWRQEFGGMPLWGIVGGLALVVVMAVGALALRPETVAADPSRQPRPVPTFTFGTPAPEIPTVAFIGDSYTSGAGSTSGGFVARVSDALGWAPVNLGRGGTGYVLNQEQVPSDAQNACGRDYCESFPEMIDDAVSASPSIVVVSGGRNDWRNSASATQESIDTFYRDLRAALPDAQIYVTSPLWDAEEPPARLAEISSWVRGSSESVGAVFLDIGQPLQGRPDLVGEDGIHPNDAGYDAISESILTTIGD